MKKLSQLSPEEDVDTSLPCQEVPENRGEDQCRQCDHFDECNDAILRWED
jgi:hypothetical protein